MKYFWLIRHAKSSWSQPGQPDHDRDLNDRGRHDGELMQACYKKAEAAHRPSWLVTSSARRAQATAAYVAAGFGLTEQRQLVNDSLYHASPERLLAALRETPAEIGCVALVAHNPGLTWLVNALSTPNAGIDNLPTLGSALFASDTESWAELNSARRVRLVTPKQLKSESC